jgi:hypothetical protein
MPFVKTPRRKYPFLLETKPSRPTTWAITKSLLLRAHGFHIPVDFIYTALRFLTMQGEWIIRFFVASSIVTMIGYNLSKKYLPGLEDQILTYIKGMSSP